MLSSPLSLTQWFDQHGITVTFLPTPLVVSWDPAQVVPTPSLRLILTGGDFLHRVHEHLPCPLINNYGPTENTVVATSTPVSVSGAPTIGHPISNVRIHILDQHDQPLPLGIPGELCIAGASLARGYLNRADLTAEHFIELDLFGNTERLYKTGDLARWRPDGQIEFLGRIDNQVKLRGFRIELGEIETVLSQHESVKDVVVTLYKADGNERLVAYVAADSTPHLSVELHHYLKARLPDYMVPSQIIVQRALPLTANGKIDRKALPDPHVMSESFEPPVTPTEVLLATLWAEVFKHESIGRRDHFFALGGHSLLATRLVTRIRDCLAVELPVRAVFEYPELRDLANYLDLYGWASSHPEAVGEGSEDEEDFEL